MVLHATLRRRVLWGLLGATLSPSVLAAPASASGYPQRPVTFISPFQAGGATDLMARVLAQKLGAALGQPFVVENRVGATGLIGETAVMRAKPDGYTILIASNSSHVIAPLLQAKRPFHPVNDFEPISMLSSYPLALTALQVCRRSACASQNTAWHAQLRQCGTRQCHSPRERAVRAAGAGQAHTHSVQGHSRVDHGTPVWRDWNAV